ncbi:hypothetical protein BG000_003486 [Podila horticola]|nr:hypothetical protein BG000_003486 [Podila horticola]
MSTTLTNAVETFDELIKSTGAELPDLKGRAEGLSVFLQLVSDRLMDEVHTHFLRNISELISRIHRYNDEWISTSDGIMVLDSADLESGQSTLLDQTSLFWILNSRLPSEQQMAFFPESPYHDAFYTITELALVYALYANPDKACLKPLKQLLGSTITAAAKFLSEHPGELTYLLFFDQTLDYNKYTSVASPSPAVENVCGRCFLRIPKTDKDRYRQLQRRLRRHPNDKKKQRRLSQFIKSHLRSPDKHKHDIDTGITKIRYILSGSISTNGHLVEPLAYSLGKKRPSKWAPKTTRQLLKDVRDVFKTPDDVNRVLPFNNGVYWMTAIDPGDHCTATSTTMLSTDTSTMENISIPRTAHTVPNTRYLQGLTHAKQKTSFTVDLDRLRQLVTVEEKDSPSSPSTDPASQLTEPSVHSGQSAMDLDNDMDPRQDISHVDEKKKVSIFDLEALVQPVQCGPSSDSLDSTFRTLAISTKQHLVSILHIQGYLRSFYGSRIFKIRSAHLRQAKRAALDKGVSQICSTAGLGTKVGAGARQPVVVVGDGNFGCPRRPSLYMQFIKHMKNKVLALNGKIFRASEFRTSRTCCQCRVEGELVGRNLICPSCGMTRDRDHNAATNMAIAAISQIDQQSWPAHLQRNSQQSSL